MFKLTDKNTPLITAHSGAEHTPPNSLDFIDTAAQSGADGVELDLRISRDGRLLFSHDPVWSSPEGKKLPVAETSFPTLQREGGFEKAEFLMDRALDRSLYLNIDLKDGNALPPLRSYLKRRDALDRAVITGLHFRGVGEMKREREGLNILLGLDHEFEGLNVEEIGRLLKHGAEFAAGNGCLGLNLEQRFLTRDHIRELGVERPLISLWTINNDRELTKALGLGADMITTNIPVRARRRNRE
jgi:glycerophosphoryl diester phosphodiesterase